MTNKHSAASYLLYLLAKREYSEAELRHKLQLKAYEPEEINQAIEQAQTNGWQSDERFATSYVRYRSQQGYGPRRLKQELQQKGIKEWVISQALSESEINFFALAERLFEKKRPCDWDLKTKQKMWRYMLSHGFYSDHFKHLLDVDDDNYHEYSDE